jgi:hypothetical protein
MARSPCREDRRPSLAIRELDDGRILLHDFGGGSVSEILDAVGLQIDALFPEKSIEPGKPERRPFPASDILRAIAHEALIVFLAAKAISNGDRLGDTDLKRLLVAASRIRAALQAGGLSHVK